MVRHFGHNLTGPNFIVVFIVFCLERLKTIFLFKYSTRNNENLVDNINTNFQMNHTNLKVSKANWNLLQMLGYAKSSAL